MNEREKYLCILLKKILFDRRKAFERMLQAPTPEPLKGYAEKQIKLQDEIFSWLSTLK